MDEAGNDDEGSDDDEKVGLLYFQVNRCQDSPSMSIW